MFRNYFLRFIFKADLTTALIQGSLILAASGFPPLGVLMKAFSISLEKSAEVTVLQKMHELPFEWFDPSLTTLTWLAFFPIFLIR